MLTQPVESPVSANGLVIRVRVPDAQPILDTAGGLNPNRWFGAPSGPFQFRVEVEDDGRRTTVAELSIRPRERVDDRKWHPLSIDLTPWAGKSVDLRFTIASADLQENPENLAGWRAPEFRATARQP